MGKGLGGGRKMWGGGGGKGRGMEVSLLQVIEYVHTLSVKQTIILPNTFYQATSPIVIPSPPTPSSHLTILSHLIRELLILFFQSQLEGPVSSNHQEPGRLQETGGREGRRENCRERRERRKAGSRRERGVGREL